MEQSATGVYDGDHPLTHSQTNNGFTYQNTYTQSEEPDNQQLAKLTQDLQALKQTTDAKIRSATHETTQLRTQMRWLTGLLIAALVALGGIAGITLMLQNEQVNLRRQQQQLTEQVRTLEQDRISTEQFDRLEQQLNSLSQRTQELSQQAQALVEQFPDVSSTQLEAIQQQLQTLEQDIRENLSSDTTLSQFYTLNETLQRLLEDQTNPQPTESVNSAQSSQPTQN